MTLGRLARGSARDSAEKHGRDAGLEPGQPLDFNAPMVKRGRGMPLVNALVLADKVYRDGASGKFIIAGTFNEIRAPKFPTRLVGAALYVNLSDFRGEHRLSLQFVALSDGGKRLGESSQVPIKQTDPLAHTELCINLPHLGLEKPGLFAIELLWDGHYLNACKFNAVLEEGR